MNAEQLLLPELSEWNHGRGIAVDDWLYTVAQSDVAVAYNILFWPRFVRFENYVLREGFAVSNVREWERSPNSSRKLVEATVNILHVDDLFSHRETWSELVAARATHLARSLRDIYRIKLAHDFPEREFEISLFDGSQEGGEISLSFWQREPKP